MLDLAQEVIRLALDAGATAAECTIAEGDEFSANVRMRELETLKEAGSRAAGLRVLIGKRVGSSYTSDLGAEGIRHMVRSALEIAKISTEDPHAGLPDASELGSLRGDLKLYSDDVDKLDTAYKIQQALEAEQAAFDTDARITNSEGASFDSGSSQRVFANSLGFAGSYRSSSCSLTAVPVAQQGDSMERDYWHSVARSSADLETPAEVGRRAAERAARRLGARKIPTQKAPVIFEPRTARSLIDHIFDAIDGESVYRKASFLADKLGEKIADESITIIDDATIPGLFGSAPFDDEGVPSRRTVVIERGVLRNYLLNTYTARKLGLRTTGNASRGITGNASVGNGNFYLEKGSRTPEEIIRSMKSGLYVTELIGTGVNIVTGDYSRGAAGMWIENGEFAYPVSEITIAANLQQMLMDIEYIGNDLEFRGSMASPTIVIREMTISGQ
ncbi:MAG: metallopeptidase TldD-related protein [Acidobacteriota bacterium]|nr:metallopeptidase TldD-related protein [Acidobacteriota bacterium]